MTSNNVNLAKSMMDDSIINPYNSLLNKNGINPLFQIPVGVKNIPELSSDKLNRSKSPIELLALLNPPDTTFTSVLNSNEQVLMNNVNQSTDLQLIKQFYEAYYSPIGLNDVNYRLGEVSSVVNDLHEMIPDGAQAVLSDGEVPDWRTNINYVFKVNTGLKDSKGLSTSPSLYINYAFGPMTPRLPNDLSSNINNTSSDYDNNLNLSNDSNSFDIENLYYKGNRATLRRPGFKSINDNINLIQFLYEKAFGVESTYINEWDLSIYMQEGLVDSKQVEDINHLGQFVIAPVFVTNLTFGLINDSPIKENIDNNYYKQLTEDSLDRACVYGSFNLAVSNRKAVDSVTFSKSANTFIYNISSYPLSKYWVPSNAGENLNYTTKVSGDDVIYSDMNVSMYWDELFALRDSGKIYAAALDNKPKYTTARIFGKNLRAATRPFEYLLKYEDNKQACLSGWNSTDDSGEIVGRATSSGADNPVRNYYNNGNTYAWLPYWKQFFFNPGEGLEDLDQYWQSLYGDGQEYHSFLTVSDDILGIISADNKPLNSFRSKKVKEYNNAGYSDSDPKLADDFKLDGGKNSGYGNIKVWFPIIKTVEIPKTKLLNMFLNKSNSESKAMDKSKDKDTSSFLKTGSIKVSDGKNKGDQLDNKSFRVSLDDPDVIIDPVTGKTSKVSLDEDIQTEEDPIGKNLSYADGVNNFSPFLYGGPHGTNFSPNTIEGYINDGPFLKNVPTMPSRTKISPSIDNKNLLQGSFLSSRLVLGLVDKQLAIQDRRSLLSLDPIKVTYTNSRVNNKIVKKTSTFTPKNIRDKAAKLLGYKSPEAINSVLDNKTGTSYKLINEIWNNGVVNSKVSYSRYASPTSFLKDFTGDFRLTPIPKNWNANTEINTTLLQNNMKKHQRTAVNKSDKAYVSNDVYYLLYKQADYGHIKSGNYYHNPVYDPDSDFGNLCRQLYEATKNGTKKIPLSFNIKNKNGDIETTVITLAKIIKTPKVKRKSTGWFLERYSLNRYREVYTTKVVDCDAYNMIIDPLDVSYILPNSESLKTLCGDITTKNKRFRDLSSNDIIDRWGLPTLDNFHNNLVDLYPFSLDYFNRFGYNITNNIGRSNKVLVNSTAVKVSSIMIGNVLQDYIKNNGRVKLRLSSVNRLQTITKSLVEVSNKITKNTTTTKKYWVLFKTYVQKLHRLITNSQTKHSKVTLYSNVYLPQNYKTKEDSKWAAFILKSLNGVNVSCYETGSPLKNKGSDIDYSKMKYCAFDSLDVFDSFIETCDLQKAWLTEMKDFAERYLSDKTIYSTYLAVTDPNIINIINKANANQSASKDVYYTGSFTEDINYFASLAILDEAMKGKEDSNTIKDLIQVRITELSNYKSIAEKLKKSFSSKVFNSWSVLEKFSIFLTDVYGAINGSLGCRELLLNKEIDYNNIDIPYLSQSNVDKTFNLIENPTTLVWAYLNVLYQARKFYINKRLDKVSGSYWILRSLERVLTFQAARSNALDKQSLIDDTISKAATQNTNKDISFVESRDTQNQLASKSINDISPSFTKAVYVPVKYISDPFFMRSNKYNKKDNTYNGFEIAYVNQVSKTAYKPENGYYYIMSKDIQDNIVDLLNKYENIKRGVKSGKLELREGLLEFINHKVTEKELYNLIKNISKDENIYLDENGQVIEERVELFKSIYLNKTLKEAIKYKLIDSSDIIDLDSLDDSLQLLNNRLLKYYADIYTSEINSNLYKVYIDWNTSEVGVGSATSLSDIKYYIDEYQYQRTYNKKRTVVDPISNEVLVTFDGIKSGITFGVSDGLNGDIVNNLQSLMNLTANELVCTVSNKQDYWRIEVPEAYNIPTLLLKNKPVLVSEYAFEMMLDYHAGKAITIESVLTGAQNYKASPIKPYDKTMLTDTTSISLTGVPSADSLGVLGLSSKDVNPKFG